MRKGDEPRLVFDKKGHLVAIATGADACSEHEVGIRRLMQKLGANPPGQNSDRELINAMREGLSVPYPDLMERLHVRDTRAVRFGLCNDEAVLWTTRGGYSEKAGTVQELLQDSEFRYPPPEVSGRARPRHCGHVGRT